MATLSRPRFIALVAVLSGTGCASFLRPDGPRTVPPGSGAFHLAPSAYASKRDDGSGFNLDLMYRRGVAARADAGLRLNLFGVAGDVKVHLVRAEDPTRGVEVAVAPSLGYGADIAWSGQGDDPEWALQVGLPIIVGINLGRYQLVLSPQLLYERVDVLPDGIINAGGTVALGKIGGEGFSFYPALAVWKSLDARHPVASLSSPGPLVFQPAIVLRWGP